MPRPPDAQVLDLSYRLDPEMDLERRLAVISRGNDEVLAFLRKQGRLDDADLFAFNLAYEELASNVARYGSHSGRDAVHLRLRVERTASSVALTIDDDGSPFNPFEAPDSAGAGASEGGRGIRLVRAYFPGMRYSYENRRNVVRVEKVF